MVPFEQPGATGPGVPGVYAGGHPETNEMDALAAGNALSPTLKTSLYAGVLKFGKTVQQNGLLILPDDPALQDQCSYVPIEVHNWAGKGFLIESTTMLFCSRKINVGRYYDSNTKAPIPLKDKVQRVTFYGILIILRH